MRGVRSLFALMLLAGVGAYSSYSMICSAQATQTIRNDMGGRIVDYFGKYQSGRVVVDGACASACTMVLKNPLVCATPRARFGFHAASNTPFGGSINQRGTGAMMARYPARVKAWIRAHGGLRVGAPMWATGRELGVPACSAKHAAIVWGVALARPAVTLIVSRGYCDHCEKMKSLLAQLGVHYTLKYAAMGPLTVINGERVYGWNPARIRALLRP
jgi:hypothetical protein